MLAAGLSLGFVSLVLQAEIRTHLPRPRVLQQPAQACHHRQSSCTAPKSAQKHQSTLGTRLSSTGLMTHKRHKEHSKQASVVPLECFEDKNVRQDQVKTALLAQEANEQ